MPNRCVDGYIHLLKVATRGRAGLRFLCYHKPCVRRQPLSFFFSFSFMAALLFFMSSMSSYACETLGARSDWMHVCGGSSCRKGLRVAAVAASAVAVVAAAESCVSCVSRDGGQYLPWVAATRDVDEGRADRCGLVSAGATASSARLGGRPITISLTLKLEAWEGGSPHKRHTYAHHIYCRSLRCDHGLINRVWRWVHTSYENTTNNHSRRACPPTAVRCLFVVGCLFLCVLACLYGRLCWRWWTRARRTWRSRSSGRGSPTRCVRSFFFLHNNFRVFRYLNGWLLL